jgi:manganese/zinc/iron transport system substrate-binding protein
MAGAAAIVGAMAMPWTAGAAAAQEPLGMLATVGMVADVARAVGGDCVAVETMMGPGTDPHLYQATASDVAALQRADLILYVGYTLEGQLGAVLGRFAERTPTVAVAMEAIAPDELISTGEGAVDPHLWMDVSLWARIAPVIAEAIAAERPDCAAAVRTAADTYRRGLDALHAWIGDSIATIPAAQRMLVTAHDAFEYFGRAYGIEVVAIQGISTEAEASIADVRETAGTVIAAGVPAVFVETTINPRTIQALVEAAKDAGHPVEIGGRLYSDAMGEAGTAAGTYIGMLHANTVSITESLGGTPPPLPAELEAWAAKWGDDG